MVAVTALVMACAIGYAAWEASTTDAVETGSAGRPRETAPVEGGERVLAVPSAEGGGRPVGGTWTIRPGGPYGGGRSRMYFALLLLLEGALLLLFTAQDLIVFYVGFEAMLIPLYFLMGVWGGPGRTQATLKFIIYTVGGSLLMLVGMIALALGHEGGPTFAIAELGGNGSTWIFLSFLIAFAIKSPLWPFHGWLPDAYRQSPPEVAAILSGLASKAGAYGLLRLVLPLFPGPVADWRGPIIVLATIGLLYGSILAFRQPDARGVIAYSSIAQMGLILVGIFVLNDRGASGAAFQMVNHAILSCALFLLAGWLATQTGAETFDRLGGLARGRPILASTVLVAGVATLAVPGSATFASEFLILLGAFEESAILGAIASLAIVLAAMYMLRWISAVLHESRGSAVAATAGPSDLVSGGLLAIVPLVLAILALSFYPFAVTERIDPVTTSLPSPAAAEAAR
jgi:NADH-quinone oxidoreductase subunit M